MSPISLLKHWAGMDERRTDPLGWSLNLAIVRIVFLAGAALPFARDTLAWTTNALPHLPPTTQAPILFFRFIPHAVLMNVELARWLATANIVLIICGLAGVFTRYALGLATVVSAYVFGLWYNHSASSVYHIVWFMALLAVAPSAHFLSVDAIVRAIRRADRGEVEPEVTGFAALWALRYMWVLIGLFYLVPGLAKLQMALIDTWASAENLRRLMWFKWLESSLFQPNFVMPPRVDHLPAWMIGASAWATILFETGFIVLVLLRPTRWVAALGGIAFHELNRFVLGIAFDELEVAYVCLVDWSWILRSLATLRHRQPLVALYDGGCQLCRRALAILGTIDVTRALEPVPSLANDPRRHQHAEVTDEMLMRDIYVIRGDNLLRGYDAYLAIAARMPLLWPLAVLLRFPPLAAVGRSVYPHAADSRRRSVASYQPGTAVSDRRRSRWVHGVGIFLVVAQTVVSFANYAAGLGYRKFPRPIAQVVKPALTYYQSLRVVWPFNMGPLFWEIWPATIDVWESRVVFADGREQRVGADAYAPLCVPSICAKNAQAWAAEKDGTHLRTVSLQMVQHLWRYEGTKVGTDVVRMRVYRVRYALNPSLPRPMDQWLLYEFPIGLVTSSSAR